MNWTEKQYNLDSEIYLFCLDFAAYQLCDVEQVT